MTETQTLTPQEQINRLEALLSTTKNPKQIRQYKALIQGLQAQLNKIETEPQEPEATEEQASETKPEPQTETLFSAVGVISGEVIITTHSEGKQSFEVKQGDKLYQLFFTSGVNRKRFSMEMRNSETPVKNLLVYPRVTHFPDKNNPCDHRWGRDSLAH